MPARRFFVEGTHASGDRVALGRDDAHKIVHVLRLDSGDRIDIVDSAGTQFDGILERDGPALRVLLGDGVARDVRENLEITVAQAIAKGAKMDFVVEKLTELNVARIVPVATERTVLRDPGDAKLERWRRLARTAAQQSGAARVPEVSGVVPFAELVSTFGRYDRVLFPWEAADPAPLRDALPRLIPAVGRVLIVIGPEGGFSHEEAQAAEAGGAAIVSLGDQILRTESAAFFLTVILRFLTG